jgi:hypothetical protein
LETGPRTWHSAAVTRKPVHWPQWQFTNKEKDFEGKEIQFIIHQMKRRTGRVNLSKLCQLLLKENVHFLEFGAHFEYMIKCMSQKRCWPWFSR